MTWNYRIIFHNNTDPPYYGLHEVYYNKDGSIASWTSEADIIGDDVKDIVSQLDIMSKDIKKAPAILRSEITHNIKDW